MDDIKPMGIGEIGNFDVVFVRKFRWTLRGTHLSESFVNSVQFDYHKKTITFGYMEVACLDNSRKYTLIGEWLQRDLSQEELVFTTYDGCGNSIYEDDFTGLEVISDTNDFDYSLSEVSIRKITVSYKETNRVHVKQNLSPKATIEPREVTLEHLNARIHLNL